MLAGVPSGRALAPPEVPLPHSISDIRKSGKFLQLVLVGVTKTRLSFVYFQRSLKSAEVQCDERHLFGYVDEMRSKMIFSSS